MTDRRIPHLVFLSAFVLLLGSCAFDDGEPWGKATFEVAVMYTGDAERAADEGGILTSAGYRVELEALEAVVSTAAVTVAAGGGGAMSFDPAAPPEGYSLCHNGHCHADDGSLVDYEDIEAQLAGGAGAGGTEIIQAIDSTAAFATEPTPLPLDVCSNDCQLPRGDLALASLIVTSWRVRATVYDTLTEDPRLPPEGMVIDVVIDTPVTYSSALEGSIDKDEPVDVQLSLSLSVSNRLFDNVEFDELDLEADPTPLAAAIDAASTFEVTLSR